MQPITSKEIFLLYNKLLTNVKIFNSVLKPRVNFCYTFPWKTRLMRRKIGCLQATKCPESLSTFAIALPLPKLLFSEHQPQQQVTNSTYWNKEVLAARSKAWVCGSWLAGIVGSNPVGIIDFSLVSVVFWQVEIGATGWSLVQRRPNVCGVSECYREAILAIE